LSNRAKERVGEVVSDKMDKTVVVLVKREFAHPLYKKKIIKSKRIKAHDEHNKCRKGDIVKIVESRPLSKEKCWRIAQILTPAEKERVG